MAGDASTTAGTGTGDARERLARRLGIDHRHSVGTSALVVVLALVCGLYAAWSTADLGIGLPALVVVALVAGVISYRRSTRAGVLATGLYALAVLVAVTPVFLVLPVVLTAGSYGLASPWPFVFSTATLVVVVVFVVFAVLLAGIAYLVDRRVDGR